MEWIMQAGQGFAEQGSDFAACGVTKLATPQAAEFMRNAPETQTGTR